MGARVLHVVGSRLLQLQAAGTPTTIGDGEVMRSRLQQQAVGTLAPANKGPALSGRAASEADGALSGAQGAVPYVVVSHSMGCWVAFEMLRLARAKGEMPFAS